MGPCDIMGMNINDDVVENVVHDNNDNDNVHENNMELLGGVALSVKSLTKLYNSKLNDNLMKHAKSYSYKSIEQFILNEFTSSKLEYYGIQSIDNTNIPKTNNNNNNNNNQSKSNVMIVSV